MKEERIVEKWDTLFSSITFLLEMATELKFKQDLLAKNIVPRMLTMEDIRRITEYVVTLCGSVLCDRNY